MLFKVVIDFSKYTTYRVIAKNLGATSFVTWTNSEESGK
jgi:hypothetical protein